MTEAQQDAKINQHTTQIANIQAVNVTQQTKIDALTSELNAVHQNCRDLCDVLRGIHPSLPEFDVMPSA